MIKRDSYLERIIHNMWNGEIGELYPQVLETLVYGACKELFE